MFVKVGPLFEAGAKARDEDRALELEETLDLPMAEKNGTVTSKLEEMWAAAVAGAKDAAAAKKEERKKTGKFLTEEEEAEEDRRAPRPSLFKASLRAWPGAMGLGFLLRLFMEFSSISIPFIFQQIVLWYQSPNPEWWHGALYFLALIVTQAIAFMALAYGNEFTSLALANYRSSYQTLIFKKALKLKAGQGPKVQGKIVTLHGSDVARLKEMAWIHSLTAAPFTVVGNVAALYYFIGYAALFSVIVLSMLLPLQLKTSAKVGVYIGKMLRLSDLRMRYITEVIQGIRICKFMSWEKDFETRIEKIRSSEVKELSNVIIFRNLVISLTHTVPPLLSLSVFGGAYGLGTPITVRSVFPTLVLLLTFRNAVMGIALGVNKMIDYFEILERLEDFLMMPEGEPYMKPIPEQQEGDTGPPAYVAKMEHVTFGFMDKTGGAAAPKEEEKEAAPKEEGEGEAKEEETEEEKAKGREEAAAKQVAAEAAAHAQENQPEVFKPLLTDINITFPTGSLTIVVGPTGCGKSVLIQGLLGESTIDPDCLAQPSAEPTAAKNEPIALVEENKDQKTNEPIESDHAIDLTEILPTEKLPRQPATLERVPHVAYVPQEAWIMNATIRDNIVLDCKFEQERYDAVIEACALLTDLELFPAGDKTEIGERGINLSGGQKQRLALARATYCQHNLVLLDDPLSAVDPAVCSSLFNECINGPMMQGRARVLVTHHVQFLPSADQVVVIKKGGKIALVGTYDEYVEFKEKDDSIRESGKHTGGSNLTPGTDKATPGTTKNAAGAGEGGKPDGTKAQGEKLIVAEKKESGTISAKVYTWYLGLAHPLHVLNCIVGFTMWRATQMVTDIFLQLWAYRSGGFGKSSFTDNEYLMWFGVCTAITVLGTMWRAFGAAGLMIAISSNSHRPLLTSVLKSPTEVFDTTPVGRMLNRFSKDLQSLDLILPEMSNFMLSIMIYTISIFVMMIIVAVYQIPLLIILLVIYYKILSYYTTTLRALKRLESTERSPAMAIMSESISGLEAIRAFGLQSHFISTHEVHVDRMMQALYGIRASYIWLSERTTVLAAVIMVPMSIFAILYKTVPEVEVVEVDDGFLMLAIAYALQLTANMSLLVMIGGEVDSQMNCAERIMEYVKELPHEREVVYDAKCDPTLPLGDRTTNHGVLMPPPPQNWPTSGCIEFKDVQLRYREGLPLVLKGVDAKIESGMKVGVVGRTGAGKSTIMLALFRIVELAQGSVEFDGHDISQLKMEDLRTKITIIPQDPTLFEGTIRSNLDPFDDFKDKPEDIWAALKESRMKDRVKEDKDDEGNERGLDAVVAAKGANFSVGQRQLLCLARALLRKSRVLLMDEATANVDFAADAVLQETIRRSFKHHTVITIAHRMSTVIQSDKILVLQDGLVAEFDTPLNLMDRRDSVFMSMVENLGEEQALELYRVAQERAASVPM